MIKTEGLSKTFNSKRILNNINIEFEDKIYGLLGENGAGKTTLIRCMTNIYTNYKGRIIIPNINKEIGYLPQNFGAFKELTLKDMLLFFANQKGLAIKKLMKKYKIL